MYVMHKFFGRKQGSVVREYIKNHTEHENEIVLDPFCGSGVMIGEALHLGRKAIGIDVNPVLVLEPYKKTFSLGGQRIYSEDVVNQLKDILELIKSSVRLILCNRHRVKYIKSGGMKRNFAGPHPQDSKAFIPLFSFTYLKGLFKNMIKITYTRRRIIS